MAAKKNTPKTVVLDPTLAEEFDDLEAQEYVAEASATSSSEEVDASLCPSCGEPLAWHDEACSAAAVPATIKEEAEVEIVVRPEPSLNPLRFAYAIGQPVQPAPDSPPRTVVWRGQVKERHPRTGLIYRVNVYKLDNGYWDCYFETDLQAA